MSGENTDLKTAIQLEKEQIDAFRLEIADRAKAIGEKLNTTVYPFFFKDQVKGDLLAGFLSEPNRITKLRFMDKTLQGPMMASMELLEAILIKDETDPRIYSERPEHDVFFIGAVTAARDIIKESVDLYKKK